MNLREPIGMPDVRKVMQSVETNIARLKAKATAYDSLAALAATPQWNSCVPHVKELVEQLTRRLINEKDSTEVIRLQAEIKSYQFLLALPSSAQGAADRVRQEITRQTSILPR